MKALEEKQKIEAEIAEKNKNFKIDALKVRPK